ncbi:hypothetical protein QE152_g19086 [Popillia japonica]|uniref:Uncharacterized protein n=1 Tax=Popillia japonica TaxID=7064 RepID=A0AAW1KYK2_POPJA
MTLDIEINHLRESCKRFPKKWHGANPCLIEFKSYKNYVSHPINPKLKNNVGTDANVAHVIEAGPKLSLHTKYMRMKSPPLAPERMPEFIRNSQKAARGHKTLCCDE